MGKGSGRRPGSGYESNYDAIFGKSSKEEEEAFIEIERRQMFDDDDIQEYKKPWVELTDDEIYSAFNSQLPLSDRDRNGSYIAVLIHCGRIIEKKLREKNA